MKRIFIFHKKLATLLGLLTLILMFIIVIDACGRFMFNLPLPGAVELSRVVLAWILYLSLAWGLVQGAHVRVTLFLDRYPLRIRQMADVVITSIAVGFFVLMIYAGWIQFWRSFSVGETMAAPIWIPFWFAKLAVPVGSLLIVVQFPFDLITRLRSLEMKKTTSEAAGRREA